MENLISELKFCLEPWFGADAELLLLFLEGADTLSRPLGTDSYAALVATWNGTISFWFSIASECI